MRPIHATLWAFVALTALGLPVPAAPTPPGDSAGIQAAPGEFLIAAPEMGDPRFDHAVVLLVQHDKDGAFGIVVNRPIEEKSLAGLLEDLGQKTDGVSGKVEIYAGGPVEADIGFVLHSAEYRRAETMKIDGKVAVTSSPAVLLDIAQKHGPQKYMVAFGYAGWGPGQLENELAQRAWFIAPGDAKLLFDDDPEKLWQDVLDRREQAL